MNYKSIFRVASLLGLLAVVLGAFAAHALRGKIDEQSIDNWQTANRYQFYHVFALLIAASILMKEDSKMLRFASMFFIAGISLFCGSLYFLSVRSLFTISLLWLGPVTPL